MLTGLLIWLALSLAYAAGWATHAHLHDEEA